VQEAGRRPLRILIGEHLEERAMSDGIRKIDTGVLKAMRDLCPKAGDGLTSVEFSSGGKTVRLTAESRKRADEELKRRKKAK
jgi:hypothetical protein